MKSAIFTTEIEKVVYNEDDKGESFSAISLNPTFAWIKFILTDDLPNDNKQRVPLEEFSNLIKTGVHAPIKMYLGEIKEDHEDAIPLGVITHLKEVGNKIEGMAALWSKEREKDIQLLKEMYANGNLPQLSWEILYSDSSVDENGVEDLHNTALRATTIVGMPAYAGRTSIFAMASKNKDSKSEEENVEELEQLKAKVEELTNALASKDGEITSREAKIAELEASMEELRQYKETAEKEKEATLKLQAIKDRFAEAKLDKGEEYFEEKKDLLLSLSDEALDYMIQELAAFSSKQTEASDKSKKTEIPNLQGNDEDISLDPKRLAEELRKRLSKK